MHELSASQPQVLQRLTRTIPDMLPKAYRWVGEMEEISSFVAQGHGCAATSRNDDGGVEGEELIHRGLAKMFARIQRSLEGKDSGEDVKVLKGFADEAKKVLGG